MTDRDTFLRDDTYAEVVKGTSKLLQLSPASNNGKIDALGNSPFEAFVQLGEPSTTTSTDDLVVKEVMYEHISGLDAGNYPLVRRCRYVVTDPAQGPTQQNPYSVKDYPGAVQVDKLVQVTAS